MGPYWVLLAVAIAATLTLPVAVLVFAPTPVSSQETRAARLVASVAADKETYLPGEPVIITFRVMNEGNAIADIRFGSTCLATYSILSVDGTVAYVAASGLDDHDGAGRADSHCRVHGLSLCL